MVGGTIIEVSKEGPNRLLIQCQDKLDKCFVRLDPGGFSPKPGDRLWWQNGVCYWTPANDPSGAGDVPLTKIGYSFRQ